MMKYCLVMYRKSLYERQAYTTDRDSHSLNSYRSQKRSRTIRHTSYSISRDLTWYCQAQVRSPKSQSKDQKDLGWHYNNMGHHPIDNSFARIFCQSPPYDWMSADWSETWTGSPPPWIMVSFSSPVTLWGTLTWPGWPSNCPGPRHSRIGDQGHFMSVMNPVYLYKTIKSKHKIIVLFMWLQMIIDYKSWL